MLQRQIERVKRSKQIDSIILATSNSSEDDPLEGLAKKMGIPCFRGSLEDVLDRFYRAAQTASPDHVVRLTGDCPLADPDVIDEVIKTHLENANDYTSNGFPPTFPDGLDVEVIQFSALEAAWKNAKSAAEREHVTYFLYNHPELFRLGNYSGKNDLSALRWTVDEPRDFLFVEKIYSSLFPLGEDFRLADILDLLSKHPELKALNQGIARNEGLQASLDGEKKVDQ